MNVFQQEVVFRNEDDEEVHQLLIGDLDDNDPMELTAVTDLSYLLIETNEQMKDYTTQVIDGMFLDGEIAPMKNWDVSQVTSMKGIFKYCELHEVDLTGWDVSNVKDFSEMFKKSYLQKVVGIETWKVSKDADLSEMFQDCPFQPVHSL
jgi:hypothetical protein